MDEHTYAVFYMPYTYIPF